MSTPTTDRPADLGHLAGLIAELVARVTAGGDAADVAAALNGVPADAIGGFFHESFSSAPEETVQLLTTGVGASPGAASGEIVLTAEDAMEAAAAGRAVILVRPETTPDDVLGMQAARGILTARGGVSSHAAVVARGWGIPAVVGAGELVIGPDRITVADRVIPVGSPISIDGRTGEVFIGAAATVAAEAPVELGLLLEWADQVRRGADRPVQVRVNADMAADAMHGRHLGAEGIGLCRTEHMFLAEDRLPLMRRFILSDDPEERRTVLAELEDAQAHDFAELLTAMDGLPVTVRLLDPPLHEFLPDLERLSRAEATGSLDAEGRRELAAVRRMHEINPMIGTRGVRLGVVRPGLYEMQVRSLCRAIADVARAGRTPVVEVMVPLVIDAREMRLARRWLAEAVAATGLPDDQLPHFTLGAMIETPRAALLADEIAAEADFLSFGTNDLTQLVFGLSRDDVGASLLPTYLDRGLLDSDPFETVDHAGVGRGIRHATELARGVSHDIELGVCGEQAGDAASVGFFVGCGIDYLSCSPYRLPITRLAVAQALLAEGRIDEEVLDAIAVGAAVGDPGRAVTTPAGDGGAVSPGEVDDREFVVLHALRIKGFASADLVGEIAGVAPDEVGELLVRLAGAELARHLEARDLWQLTPAGRERHAELLPLVPAEEVSGLRAHYERFLELNTGFKELCARWQTRDGEPNDHQDAAYDAARVAELDDLHRRAAEVLDGFAGAVERFAAYPQRLQTALARTAAGETRMFTGVMCNSYHDVWMELHEDLIQLLGVDRHAEGSY